MKVISDQWTPLFDELSEKLNSAGRKSLLDEMISQVKVSCLSNFGENADGDMRPWYHEELVSEDYKRHVRRNFATLYRSEDERENCMDSKWEGGQGAHLKDSFFSYGSGDSAGLVNISDYASNHQNGDGVPRRPFFPVDENGNLMPFMERRFSLILDAHFQV